MLMIVEKNFTKKIFGSGTRCETNFFLGIDFGPNFDAKSNFKVKVEGQFEIMVSRRRNFGFSGLRFSVIDFTCCKIEV